MSTTSTFLGYKIYANDITKSLARVADEPTAATDRKYYLANIGKVTSVDQFVNNYKLFTYAMKAYGLEDMGNAKAFMKKVLDSDLSDKTSFANRLADSRYKAFAKAFQFTSTGAIASTAQVQTSGQQSSTTAGFYDNSTASASQQNTAVAYYTANIGKVTSVAGLEKDTQLYNYVLTAYGIDPSTSKDTITRTLESDLSDTKSFANKSGDAKLVALAKDFNFAADGSVSSARQIQSNAGIVAAVSAYSTLAGGDTTAAASTKDSKALAAAKVETTYYTTTMPKIATLDQFLSDKRLVAYAIKAYGLPATTTTGQLKDALTSDLTNPKSAANKLGSVFRSFAAAFNVTTSGTISQTPTVQAQTRSAVTATIDLYNEQTMESEAGDQSDGVRLALYFRRMAPTITSAYQILADKALTQFTQTALGLSTLSSKADIDAQARTITSKMNIADLKDPAKLEKLISRFAALYDISNASSDSGPSITTLFSTV